MLFMLELFLAGCLTTIGMQLLPGERSWISQDEHEQQQARETKKNISSLRIAGLDEKEAEILVIV